MAGIFNGPPRGGTRGGRAEFSWDSVKADESREYYLGHSVKAVTGRWQKNKDVFWYTRDKEDGESADIRREKEMAMVKQREQDLMMEALGMKPKAPRHTDAHELDGIGMPPYDKNTAATAAAPPPQSTLDLDRHRHHQSRKEKEEKKAAKRAKKEARREKKRSKDSKRRRRSRSRSLSPRGGGKEYSDSSDSEDSRDRKNRSRNRRRSRSRSPIEQHRERRRRD